MAGIVLLDNCSLCPGLGTVGHVTKRKCGVYFHSMAAVVAILAAVIFRSLSGVGLHWQYLVGAAHEAHQFHADVNINSRWIMTSAGIVDTTRTPGLRGCKGHGGGEEGHVWGDVRSRRRLLRQWFVQTRGQLTSAQRAELEADAGLILGPYFPHSAHLIVATHLQACRTLQARHVAWIGERDGKQKLDKSISFLNQTAIDFEEKKTGGTGGRFAKGMSHMPVSLNVELWPHTKRDQMRETSKMLAEQIAGDIMSKFSIHASVRAPALDKLVVEVPYASAQQIAEWLSLDAYIVGVERKTMFKTRAEDSNKVLLTGPSEISRTLESTIFQKAGLDGSGVGVGVADTGLDYDHCMLWQKPFDWPCFEWKEDRNEMLYNISKCPISHYAGLLENPDFSDFLTMMIETKVDVPLLASGRTNGSSGKRAPMDVMMPDRDARQMQGYRFSLANDTSLPVLLKAWNKVRGPLLGLLTRKEFCQASKKSCGGTIVPDKGVTMFIPEGNPPVPFTTSSRDDQTWEVVSKALGEDWMAFEKILTEKCFCFWTRPNSVTVNPIETWQGPVPFVRQFQLMAVTATAAILRKGKGLPALPVDLLENICKVTRVGSMPPPAPGATTSMPSPRGGNRDMRGVRQDMCVNVTYDFDVKNKTINVCELQWEPRAVEEVIARCVAGDYLKKPEPTQNRFDDNSRTYTYNTTLEWWQEYTTLPPINWVDTTRRVVNGYFTNEGCEVCGMCARLRLDSRTYESISGPASLPTTIDQDGVFWLHLEPEENDWRLDPWEARNVGFSMELQFSLLKTQSTGLVVSEDPGLKVGFCVLTNDKFKKMNATGTLRDKAFWATSCLNDGGKVFAGVTNASVTAFKAEGEVKGGRTQFKRKERVAELPRSADGWRVLAWNNGVSPVSIDLAFQLFTLPVGCSDLKDGAIKTVENTHSFNMENSHVRSLMHNDQCIKENRTYCDNTPYSGRQLDVCLVCGGACFPPTCTKKDCYGTKENEFLSRFRFLGEFAKRVVSKQFRLPKQAAPGVACGSSTLDANLDKCDDYSSGPGMACPSPTDPDIPCKGLDCDYKFSCRGRQETYDIHTTFLKVVAGIPYVFQKGRLIYETKAPQVRMVRVRILALTDPTWHLRTGTKFEGIQGGGLLSLPQILVGSKVFSTTKDGKTDFQRFHLPVRGRNFTETNIIERPTEIVLMMNETYLSDFLDGLQYTPSLDSGTDLSNRQKMIRIQIQFLQSNMQPWPVDLGKVGYEDGFDTKTRKCKSGFTGQRCDTITPPLDIHLTVEPDDFGMRIVRPENAEGSAGRKRPFSRDGHGTHIATCVTGKSMSEDGQTPGTAKYDSVNPACVFSFVDIATTGNAYLTPPESLGDALFSKVYTEGKARIFLNPWTCEDYVWWKHQDRPFDPETTIPFSPLNSMPSICNRYGADAWEIDDFVARHPDFTVIFPAGDSGAVGLDSVSSPGTCKNCITVGTAHSWAKSLAESVDFQEIPCKVEDCPQDFDKTETCADPKRASPYSIPACCRDKYRNTMYGPGILDPHSSLGSAVFEQAETFMGVGKVDRGNFFTDLQKLKFGRIKPDLVAPGINTVSGRSDGDPNSGGTRGVRCKVYNTDDPKDSSCLTTMSGSSVAAAKITALATLVRQYFTSGFHPSGYKGFSLSHEPSAALVKAMLIASADEMQSVMAMTGSKLNIETLPVPNRYVGFGRPRLLNVIQVYAIEEKTDTAPESMDTKMDEESEVKVDPRTMCNCSRNNTLLFSKDLFSKWGADPAQLQAAIELDPNSIRFGSDYGTKCAPWNAMPDKRIQQCNNIFQENPAARQAPPLRVYDPEVFDDTCCVSWCFVDKTCPLAQEWGEVPGMYYSTEICEQDKQFEEECRFQDISMKRQIRTAAFDHSITSRTYLPESYNLTNTPIPCGLNKSIGSCEFANFESDYNPKKGSIAQGENITYILRILGASRQHPLVIAMTFTDPVGVIGASIVAVNDLDLRVRATPLKGDGFVGNDTGKNRTFSTKSMQADRNASTIYYGNSIIGGDPHNNAEVVRLMDSGPLEIEATVYARRIADSLPGSDGLCQPFALVITGQIDLKLDEEPVPIKTELLETGICGRPPKPAEEPRKLLEIWQIALIALASGMAAAILCYIAYKFLNTQAIARYRKRMNTSAPKLPGYFSSIRKMKEEHGVARGGGNDFIILALKASTEENFYQGLPIVITKGPGVGETGIISEYRGATRRAVVDFENPVGAGSHYSIANDEGLGMGYKIGEAGYMPVGYLPQPDAENMGPVYSKQFEAQARARQASGNIDSEDLASMGIGKMPVTVTHASQIAQLHSGRYVGAAIKSGDLYSTAISAHTEMHKDDDEPEVLKQLSAEYMKSLTLDPGFRNPQVQMQNTCQSLFGSGQTKLRLLKNFERKAKPLQGSLKRAAPPLKKVIQAGSGFKVPGFTAESRNRSGLSKILVSLGIFFVAQHIDAAARNHDEPSIFDAAFGNPPSEPPSETQSQVIATLTTSAEAKSAKARRRQSLTSSQGSQDTNREKGHDEAESVASNGNLNGVKGKDKKKLLSVAFD